MTYSELEYTLQNLSNLTAETELPESKEPKWVIHYSTT